MQKNIKYGIRFIENQMKKERKFLIMKNCRKNAQKNSNGITLIALVITIIVNRVFYDKNKNISNLVGSSLWFI